MGNIPSSDQIAGIGKIIADPSNESEIRIMFDSFQREEFSTGGKDGSLDRAEWVKFTLALCQNYSNPLELQAADSWVCYSSFYNIFSSLKKYE